MPVLQTFGNASASGWKSFGSISNDFELIQTQVLVSSAAAISFTSIPATYKHLQLRIVARGDQAAVITNLAIRYNNDSGANYTQHYVTWGGGAVQSFNNLSLSAYNFGNAPGASTAAGIYNAAIVDILDYASTTKNKTSRALGGDSLGTTSADLNLRSSGWFSTAAINRVDLIAWDSANVVAGSRVSLYGVKG